MASTLVQFQTYLIEFSTTFTELFLETVDYAKDILKGRAEKSDQVATTVAGAIGYALGFPLMVGDIGKSIGSGLANYTIKKKELKKIKVILSRIPDGPLDRDTFRKYVIEGAVEFFIAYELQLRQLITQNSTNRLLVSLDACSRIFDYLYAESRSTQPFTWDKTIISRGIILGKSRNSIARRMLLRGKTRPGEIIDGKYCSSDLFTKSGIVRRNECVNPVKEKYAELGYRLSFPYELEQTNDKRQGPFSFSGKYPKFNDWNSPKLQEIYQEAVGKVLEILNDKTEESLKKLESMMADQARSSANVETKLDYHSELLQKLLSGSERNAGLGKAQQGNQRRSPIWFEVPQPVVSFTGRTKDLEKLHALVTNPQSMTVISQITTITGLGGIGKTQLASKYAFDYSQHFDGSVIWINAETLQSTRDSFLRLIQGLGLETGEAALGTELNAQVLTSLYEELGKAKCLLIFDNAEAYATDQTNFGIREYLPQNFSLAPTVKRPNILITSRNIKWGQGVSIMEINVLEKKDALQLVLDTVGPLSNEENARKLVKTLGQLPLALQQAIAYIQNLSEIPIKSFTCPIQKYLELFEANLEAAFRPETGAQAGDAYETSVMITWNITLAKIEQEVHGEKAIEFMELIAHYWRPDHINARDFTVLMTPAELNQGILVLKKYSMIAETNGAISVHRLVQKVIRCRMDESRRRAAELKNKLVHYNERSVYYLQNFDSSNSFAGIYRSYCVHVLNQLEKYQEAVHLCEQHGAESEDAYVDILFKLELGLAKAGLKQFTEAEDILTNTFVRCTEMRSWSLAETAVGYIKTLFEAQGRTEELPILWRRMADSTSLAIRGDLESFFTRIDCKYLRQSDSLQV